MTLKNDLKPTGRNRVIDLVSAAGIDVSPWGDFSRGAKWAAANPKYCYEWGFLDPGKLLVLNLWYAHIKEASGTVTVTLNMRKDSQRLAAAGAKSVWVKRAGVVDELIQAAVKGALTVRAIINDGTMRDSLDPKAKASSVERRFLDPVPWTISSYNTDTGECLLSRGGKQLKTVDQFDIPALALTQPEQVDKYGKAFLRDPVIRFAALKRANGRCEYCGALGFALPDGSFFLETHHVHPLSEGGPDSAANVAAICPNHHREAHYGAAAKAIASSLNERLASKKVRGLTTA